MAESPLASLSKSELVQKLGGTAQLSEQEIFESLRNFSYNSGGLLGSLFPISQLNAADYLALAEGISGRGSKASAKVPSLLHNTRLSVRALLQPEVVESFVQQGLLPLLRGEPPTQPSAEGSLLAQLLLWT